MSTPRKEHQMLNCRLCRADSCVDYIRLDRSPRVISRLLKESELAEDQPFALHVYQCTSCGFVQTPAAPESSVYSDYVLSWMHIKALRDYRTQLSRDYVNRLSRIGKRVLDVGCGSGEFMECLKESGSDPSGIEPSLVLVEEARRKGFSVIHDFVRDEAFLPGERYDGFTCLQVLEHLEEPIPFLKSLRSVLTTGSVGLIEVPRLEKILEENRFYDFFADHVNYFSESTLRLTCELAGFQVADVQSVFEDQFLVAHVTPAVPQDGPFHQDVMFQSLVELKQWAQDQFRNGKRLAAWGAGYKSIAALAELDLPNLHCVIDSDPKKLGLYTPVSHLRVTTPDILHNERIDGILLMAVAYKKEILHQLRDVYGYHGPVVAMGRQLEFL